MQLVYPWSLRACVAGRSVHSRGVTWCRACSSCGAQRGVFLHHASSQVPQTAFVVCGVTCLQALDSRHMANFLLKAPDALFTSCTQAQALQVCIVMFCVIQTTCLPRQYLTRSGGGTSENTCRLHCVDWPSMLADLL
jgi:hypothetical protein